MVLLCASSPVHLELRLFFARARGFSVSRARFQLLLVYVLPQTDTAACRAFFQLQARMDVRADVCVCAQRMSEALAHPVCAVHARVHVPQRPTVHFLHNAHWGNVSVLDSHPSVEPPLKQASFARRTLSCRWIALVVRRLLPGRNLCVNVNR
jgi:hypothetical protein